MGSIRMDLFIGLDLGGTWLKYGVGTADGRLLFRNKRPSGGTEGRRVIFENMIAAIGELVDAVSDRGTVRAVGVGSPGIVDFEKGIVAGESPNLPGWEGADIRGVLGKETGYQVYADNDANVMALAESRLGAAKGARNAIFITLGTGIGGGILIEGQIYRGSWCAGAELGHTVIRFDGRPCNCGNVGCVEQYASAPGMIRTFNEHCQAAGRDVQEQVTTEDIFRLAGDGDQQATTTIRDTAYYLGVALANFANAFNPEIIVIGGGVAEAGEEFIRMVEKETARLGMDAAVNGLRIVKARMGNEAGTIGAMMLAAEAHAEQGKRKT